MARPRQSLNRTVPGLAQTSHAAMLEPDLGAQIVDTSLAANTAGAVNIILNSLLSSNVVPVVYPIKGFSYHVSYQEATDPTRSAVFISVNVVGNSAYQSNLVVPARVVLLQRAE